ncbi:MAG: DUF4340 domain-containing protein [Candidatus Sulfotelmatobacter sp.]
MKIRGLIVAALVFLILGGILYWSDRQKPADDKASADASPAILKVDASGVTKLDLKKRGATPIVLTKSDSGKWEIIQPQPFGADQSVVSGMLSRLSSLNSERVVEDKASDVSRYGLNPPVLQLDLTEKDNKTRELLIGDDTPTGSAAYAMLAGDPRVFTMPAYAKVSIDKSLNDLRDKRLLTVNADKISRLELIRKNQDIEFGRNKDDWQILKPKPLRADSSQVSELVRKLTDARMDLSSNDPKEAATAFAQAAPFASAKLTDESGIQELQVRKKNVGTSGEAYYAKSSAVEGVYRINSDVGQALNKTLDDFRNKKLLDFGFVDPNKIELHFGTKSYFLVRSGDDWWWNGKKMDAGTVQSLISDLRDLSSDRFPDSGFANPTIDVTVISGDGKRIERVLIAKSGNGYVAKRENEPALYQLNSSSVDDLQKAADAIKPAATATK